MKKFKHLFRGKKQSGTITPLSQTTSEEGDYQQQEDDDDFNLDYSEIKSTTGHNFKEVDNWFEEDDNLIDPSSWHNNNNTTIDEETFNLDYVPEEHDSTTTPAIVVTNDKDQDHGDEITLAYCKDIDSDDGDNTSNDDEDFDFQHHEIIPSSSIPIIATTKLQQQQQLNQDTFFCIQVYLEDVSDMIRLGRVCKSSYASFRDPYLWRNEIKKRITIANNNSMTLYPELLNNNIIHDYLSRTMDEGINNQSPRMESLDVIYKYSRLLMENKVAGIRRQDGIIRAQKFSDIATIEKKQQAIKDSEKKVQGLVSLVVVSFLLGIDLMRDIMSVIAYIVYFGATIIVPILVYYYYWNLAKKGKENTFKKGFLPFALFSSALFLYQFSVINTIMMIVCSLALGFATGYVFVEKRIAKQVGLLSKDIDTIREDIKQITKETTEKVEHITKISKRIPISYRFTPRRDVDPQTSNSRIGKSCMIQ